MSKRDVLIIKFLIIVLIGGLIYYFGHMQLSEELNSLRAERARVLNENETFDQSLNLLSTLNLRIPIYEDLIASIAEEYTRSFEQAEYILYLKTFLDNSNIVLYSFSYTEPRALPIFSRDHHFDQSREAHNVMGYNSYRLRFHATNEQLLTFLRLTEESGRGFTSSNTVISSEVGDEFLDINMELRFFYLADMDELTLDYDFSEILDNALFIEERLSIFQ